MGLFLECCTLTLCPKYRHITACDTVVAWVEGLVDQYLDTLYNKVCDEIQMMMMPDPSASHF
jgi:hypothetical protein